MLRIYIQNSTLRNDKVRRPKWCLKKTGCSTVHTPGPLFNHIKWSTRMTVYKHCHSNFILTLQLSKKKKKWTTPGITAHLIICFPPIYAFYGISDNPSQRKLPSTYSHSVRCSAATSSSQPTDWLHFVAVMHCFHLPVFWTGSAVIHCYSLLLNASLHDGRGSPGEAVLRVGGGRSSLNTSLLLSYNPSHYCHHDKWDRENNWTRLLVPSREIVSCTASADGWSSLTLPTMKEQEYLKFSFYLHLNCTKPNFEKTVMSNQEKCVRAVQNTR